MATQEERLEALISRLQGQPLSRGVNYITPRQATPQFYEVPEIEPGSILGSYTGMPQPQPQPDPILYPQAMPSPPQLTPREDLTAMDLFSGAPSGVIADPATTVEELDESDNPFWAFTRGIGRGGAQSAISIGEGLFSIADVAANVAGYEDLIDPETSETFKNLNEAREWVGNERTVVGKLGEAVGSMLTIMAPAIGAIGQAGKAASLMTQGAQYANAAKRAKGLAIGFRGLQGAAAVGSGSGQASQMMKAYKDAGGDYTIGQRNQAIMWGIPIGALELIGPEMILRGFGKELANPIKNEILRRVTGLGANATGEGAQEALSGVLQELAAKYNYDPERPIGDSMLSDFGYGAGAAAILDLVIGKRTPSKPSRSDKDVQKEYSEADPIEVVDTTLLEEKILSGDIVPAYDANGEQIDVTISRVNEEEGVAEVIDEDGVVLSLPLDSHPNQDGYSFASNQSLSSPGKYKIGGVELGTLEPEQLRQLGHDIVLTDDLKERVANGEISQTEANEQTDLSRLNARELYDLTAIGMELDRRGFEVADVDPRAEDELRSADKQSKIDSGQYADDINDNLAEIGGDKLTETYFDPKAPTKDAVDEVGQARKDQALKDIQESTNLQELFKRFNLTAGEKLTAISKAIGVERVDELRKAKGKKKVKADDLIEGLTPEENIAVIEQARSIKLNRKLDKEEQEKVSQRADELDSKTEEETKRQPVYQLLKPEKIQDAIPEQNIEARYRVVVVDKSRPDKNNEFGYKTMAGATLYATDADSAINDYAKEFGFIVPNDYYVSGRKPNVVPIGESVVEEVVEEEAAPTEFYSQDVENSKPRYRDETPEFESLSDKALYIVRDGVNKSKKDASIIEELKAAFPGVSEAELRSRGSKVAEEVKKRGEAARKRNEEVFTVPTVVPQETQPVVEEVTEDLVEEVVEDEAPQTLTLMKPKYNKRSKKYDIQILDQDGKVVDERSASKLDVNTALDNIGQEFSGIEIPVKFYNKESRNENEPTTDELGAVRESIEELLPQGIGKSAIANIYKVAADQYRTLKADNPSIDVFTAIEEISGSDEIQNLIFDADPDFMRIQGAAVEEAVPVVGVEGTEVGGQPVILRSTKPIRMDMNQQTRVSRIVKSIAPEANLVIADQIFSRPLSMPDALTMVEHNGQVIPKEEALGLQIGNVVAVSAQDGFLDPENRAYHEATHFLMRNRYLNDKEMDSLRANIPRLQSIVRKHLGDRKYANAIEIIPPDKQIDELVAYASALYNRGLDVTGKIPGEFTPPLRRIFNKIINLFKQLKSAFDGEVIMELEEVFESIRQGRAGARAPRRMSDKKGMSGTTPLAMVKQGDATARIAQSDFVRPMMYSVLKDKINKAGGSKPANDWIRRNEDGSLEGFLTKDVKLAEIEDSGIVQFLEDQKLKGGENVKVSASQLIEEIEENEVLIEVNIYGTPLDSMSDPTNENKVALAFLDDREAEIKKNMGRLLMNPAISSAFVGNTIRYVYDAQTKGSKNKDVKSMFSPELAKLLDESQAVDFQLFEELFDGKITVPEYKELANQYYAPIKRQLRKDLASPANELTSGNIAEMWLSYPSANSLMSAFKNPSNYNDGIGKHEASIPSLDMPMHYLNILEKAKDDYNLNLARPRRTKHMQKQLAKAKDLASPQAATVALRRMKLGFGMTDRHMRMPDVGDTEMSIEPGSGMEMGPDYGGTYLPYTSTGARNLALSDALENPENRRSALHNYLEDNSLNYREVIISAPLASSTKVDQEQHTKWKQGAGGLTATGQYVHAHFRDTVNPIMHIRLSDVYVTDENGDQKKILIVEEIQSDLHQEAQSIMKRMAAFDLFKEGRISEPDFDKLSRDEKNLVKQNAPSYKDQVYGPILPNMPLKNEDQRMAFAMNGITRMAINGGYSHIAVSNSELQLERYRGNFKNHIDGIAVAETVILDDGNSSMPHKVSSAFDASGNPVMRFSFDTGDLESIYGISKLEASNLIKDGDKGLYYADIPTSYIQQKVEANIDLLMKDAPEIDEQGFVYEAEELGPLEPEYIDQLLKQYPDKEQAKKDTLLILAKTFEDLPNKTSIDIDSIKIVEGYDAENRTLENIDPRIIPRLSMQESLAELYPELVNAYRVSYTVPVFDMATGAQESIHRGTYLFGKYKPLDLADNSAGGMLDDFLGTGLFKLVEDEMASFPGREIAIDNVMDFINSKTDELMSLREGINSGQEDSEDAVNRSRILDDADIAKAISDAKRRADGAVDYPVGSGFTNIYDRMMPKALAKALGSTIKKKESKVRNDNQGSILYIGDADADQQAIITNIKELEWEGERLIPAERETRKELASKEMLVEDIATRANPDVDPDEVFGLDQQILDLAEDKRDQYLIRKSAITNSLPLFEVTDEMRDEGASWRSEPYAIYQMAKQDDRNTATNAGVASRNEMSKTGRQSITEFIDSIPFFNTLKDLPQKREYYLKRGEFRGLIAQAENAAKYLRDEIGNKYLAKGVGAQARESNALIRNAIYTYMTTGDSIGEQTAFDALNALDPRAAKASAKAKDVIENVGAELVAKGLMSPQTYMENQRSYLPRLYLKHIIEDPSGKALEYLKERSKNLPEASRELLGEIAEQDPAFLASRAMQRSIRDLELINFLNAVSENENWTSPDDMFLVSYEDVNGKTKQVSAFWLSNEADTLRKIAEAEKGLSPEKSERLNAEADRMEAAATAKYKEYADANDGIDVTKLEDEQLKTAGTKYFRGFKRVPAGRKFGMLAGRLVRDEIYEDVVASSAIANVGDTTVVQMDSLFKKSVAVWKTIKVPLNPPTIARNTFSNMILMHLSGIPFYKVLPRMVEAIGEIRAYNNRDYDNARHYMALVERGVTQSSFADQELVKMSDDIMDFLGGVDAKDLGLYGWLKLKAWGKLATKASNMYQNIEVMGKTAIAIDVMEREGLSADDAFLRAQEYLFDYSDVPGWVRKTRTSPFGIPFITFQYKVLPVLMKTAINNPLKFAPYVALSYAMPHLMMSAFDIDDDEYEAIKASVPDYLRGNPGLMPLPYRDDKGRLKFLDTSFLYPWGAFTGIGSKMIDAGKAVAGKRDYTQGGFELSDVTSTFGMFGGPAWSLVSGVLYNKDPFTEQPIVNAHDPWWIANAEERPFYNRGKLTDAFYWAANQYILPGFLNTDYGAVKKLFDATSGTRKPTGLEPDSVNQALLRMIGLNVINIDPEQIRVSLYYIDRERSKVTSNIKRIARDQSITPAERRRRMQNYQQTLSEYDEMQRALTNAGAITRGVIRRIDDKERFSD